MTTELARPEDVSSALNHYLGTGDLSQLQPHQRAAMYVDTCRSLGLNPRTRPFDFIEFYDPETKAKKLTFYARSTCADQLAFAHRIRIETVEEKMVGTMYKVVLRGTMPDGRAEENVAYVDLCDRDGNVLRGQRYGDRLMKAFTKAKRRLVLGMVGLNTPADLEDLRQPKIVTVDGDGNVIVNPTEEQRHLAEHPEVARAIGEPTFEDHADAGAVPDDLPDQRPDTSAWGAPKRPSGAGTSHPSGTTSGPRPSFRPSDEDVRRWLGAWFGTVKGLSLDHDDERHRFVRQYTATIGWPLGKQTDSLKTMFGRMTEAETADFLAHVRAVCEGEKAALLERAADEDGATADDDEEPFL